MDIAFNLGLVLAGLAGLYFGAEWLVRGASGIAISAGLSILVVGLTVVAFGTSAPELVVSLLANLKDKGDFALGNVIGSNICNLGLVLAVAAIMTPLTIQRRVTRLELPLLLMATVGFISLVLINGEIGRPAGLIFSVSIVAYTLGVVLKAKRQPEQIAAEIEGIEDIEAAGQRPLKFNVGLALIGMLVLMIGSNALVTGGEFLAAKMGVSEAVIALTLVAFGTSLPELATTVVACLKNESDLAAGNAIGSCLFNILCVSGFTALTKPIVSTNIAIADLLMMATYPIAVLILANWKAKISRGAGATMLITYLCYVIYLGLR